MKRVMHRLFWAWDFDREEDWLNAWAARGWALVDVCGFRYVFEESAPGEYEYRLELLEHATSNAESRRIEVLVLTVLLVQVTTAASLLHRGGFLPEMLPIAVLWAAIMILMACGFVRIARKLRRLKRERAVRE